MSKTIFSVQVIDVSNARCRVDIGCADAFGHLHVRDMHFLPAALAAGKGIVEGCDFPEKELSILDSAEDRRNLAEDRQLHNVTKLSQDESVVQDWIYSVFSFVKPGDFLQLGIKTIDATKKRIRLTTQPPDSDQHGGPNCKRIPIEGLYVSTFWSLRRSDFIKMLRKGICNSSSVAFRFEECKL